MHLHIAVINTIQWFIGATSAARDLPSWQDGPARSAVIEFVGRVTDAGGPDYPAPAHRIAVFDNDGTLWSEQPAYFQLLFAIDRVRALAKSGERSLLQLVMARHAGMTTGEFQNMVLDWIQTARHPRFKQPYTGLVYQPMLELLGYLRSNGYQTFIVSRGSIEFMRPWVETVYGVPVFSRLPEIDFVDDRAGKPVGIHRFIGRRPAPPSAIPTVTTSCCNGPLPAMARGR